MKGTGRRLSFEDTPWEMVLSSERVARARSFIFEQIDLIEDKYLRNRVHDMFSDVDRRPALIASEGELAQVNESWVDKLRLPLPYDPTWAAPGASFDSHHGYPGGWAIHTALNLMAAVQMAEQAQQLKDLQLDLDAMIAAMVLHDWAKLKLLRWREDHTLDAYEGYGHHPIVIAETMRRGFPPEIVHLLAGVHNGWWQKPQSVERDIRNAAGWIGIDVDGTDYLRPSGRHTVEAWIMRQAEANWYGVTRETVQRLRDIISAWCADRQIPYTLEQVQSALYCTWDELYLNQVIARYDTVHLFEQFDAWYRTVDS